MFSRITNFKILIAVGTMCLPACLASAQAWKPLIGYTELMAEKGASLEDGTGIVVMQAEAPDGSGNYMPNTADSQFSGKMFIEGSGASGSLSHATTVGRNFFGNTNSMTPGITNITGYNANDYLGNILGINSGNDPVATTAFDVGNHSYVGRASASFTAALAEDILERFDYVINRDNTVMVVGSDNGSASATPRVLAPSYNAITVRRSDGQHSQSLTPNYGNPRYAVHLVVPSAGATSFSTPVVSSAAALLREAGAGTNFIQNEVIRSTLFAGATKDEFAAWDRTSTRPMDEVFGFGELNILNSYHVFEGGEFNGSTSDPSSNIDLLGWDYGNFDGINDQYYDFSIDPNQTGVVSAVLSWNMEITDTDFGPGFSASRNLADLNLDLYDSTGSFMGSLVDSSNGSDYNNEHIYAMDLAAGDYTFRVSGNSATDFGFSWLITTAVPEPSGLSMLVLAAIGICARRRRRTAV